MSGGRACTCPRGPDQRTHWYVTAYRCNYSAFSGYHRTPSAYSAVRCARCLAFWRTTADYVNGLPQRAMP